MTVSDDITLGELLVAARREMGVSIDEASAATRVSVRVIEAFENDDYDAMPPRGYAQNMLAAYARYLGISTARTAHLYMDGFEAAALGYRPHGADEYRRGRPIDVSQAGIVDPHYGRKRGSRGLRPSISRGDRDLSQGRTGSQPRVSERRPARSEDMRSNGSNSSARPYARPYGSLERPGIDDASAPDRIAMNTRWRRDAKPQRETDARRYSAREGRRQVRETRQGQTHANQSRSSQQRASRQSSRGGTVRQAPRGSNSTGFGRGIGVARDREDARRRREASPIERLKAFIPFIAVAIIVIIAISLFVSANGSGHSKGTVSVQTSSAVTSNDTSTTSDAAHATTQTGTTRTVTGSQSVVRYEVTIESGHTCDVTVTIDGAAAYTGTVVGPATQSYTASKSATFEFSTLDGVALTREGKSVSPTAGESGTGSYSETLSQGR